MEPIIKTLVEVMHETKLLHAPWNVGGRNIISLFFGFLVRGKKGGVSREFQKLLCLGMRNTFNMECGAVSLKRNNKEDTSIWRISNDMTWSGIWESENVVTPSREEKN